MMQTMTLERIPEVAQTLLDSWVPLEDRATIVGFEGELGAGKTTLIQEIGTHFGDTHIVTSPTFVLAKWYENIKGVLPFTHLVHIDAYRVEDEGELSALNFETLARTPRTLVLIEWPSRIQKALAIHGAQYYRITHDGDARTIEGPYAYST